MPRPSLPAEKVWVPETSLYYREKDDCAKHQLPNRPQLERGGTHLTTSENHRRLSTQSECSDSVICLQEGKQQQVRHVFLPIFLPRSTTPTHVFFRSINSPMYCMPITSLLMTISLTPVLACSIHLTKSLPLTLHSKKLSVTLSPIIVMHILFTPSLTHLFHFPH